MECLVPLALTLAAAALGVLYLLGAFRRRRPGEPPLDKGLVPWLGHVLEFRRNTVKFLERMQQKHGDVFTVQLGGHYLTFLQDPFSLGAFTKESREKLNFNKFARQFLSRVFSYSSAVDYHGALLNSSNKRLQGDGLEVMTQAMTANLQNLMLHSIRSGPDQRAWVEDGLFTYCYNVVFRAGYLSLYGNLPLRSDGSEEAAKERDRRESEALFHEFRKYDQLFPDLAYGILTPKKRLEVQRLLEVFWDAVSVSKIKSRDHISGWVRDMVEAREERGMTEDMITRYMFVLLWASQGNTGPSSFWLLLFLMKHPEAMEAAKKEVEEIVKQSGQEVSRDGPLLDVTREMLTKATILDSIIEETLRLTAAPLLTRAVLQDMTIKMADGREYWLREGDRMAVFPYNAVQMDPEIHPDPRSFRYDRFLRPDGSKKSDFYKGGKRVRYCTMPWGAGVSMCPGRFFATNEMKQFVFLMLVYFQFQLTDPEEKIPGIDNTRWGFGTMHPDREVRFRYRLIS